MATLACFHAHPDDETIATGGVMALAKSLGHRVVLVVATKGEHGEIQPDVLDDGEALWERRVREVAEAAEILGVDRVEYLGYIDSGMMGEPTNDLPGSFWTADLDEATERLASILREESVDVLTVYDAHGGYGHPDHIQVHRVGHLAGAAAGVPRVLEATMDRDAIFERMTEAMERGELPDDFEVPEATEDQPFGSPSEVITHEIDVTPFLSHKRDALAAHASQVGPDSFFLSMPDHAFAQGFGLECFIDPSEPRPPGAPRRTDLFEGL
jgi:LmbE family N-acetylglucosaminyl deacetylase